MFRALLRYGGFTMELTTHGRRPEEEFIIPKPPMTPRHFIVEKAAAGFLVERAPLQVLVFQKAKKLDEFGFQWEYWLVREDTV